MLNIERIMNNLDRLKAITDPNHPFTRRAFTKRYLEGRQWLINELKQIGLTPFIDSAGNLRAILQGETETRIYFGSHSDTVPAGGAYDGILGVVAGLEILRYFIENQIKPYKTLEFIDFLAEETTDWGISCIGSRALTGHLSAEHLALMHPETGETLAQAMTRMGADFTQPLPTLPESQQNTFVELHIEQGPVLEATQIDIGIVTHIVGITRLKITFKGTCNHSGTTPMNLRQDALVMAAQAIVKTQKIANQIAEEAALSQHYFVATCGKISNFPNAINVVPGSCELILDIRTTDNQYAELFRQQMKASLHELSQNTEQVTMEIISQTTPVTLDRALVDQCETLAQKRNISSIKMPSGAGHDAAFMAEIAKTVMIFIPSIQGISHNPLEFSTQESIQIGADQFGSLIFVLAQADDSV